MSSEHRKRVAEAAAQRRSYWDTRSDLAFIKNDSFHEEFFDKVAYHYHLIMRRNTHEQ